MKKFLTLFPNAENVHLIKDVGMIPYILQKNNRYISGIASFKNGEYSYFEKEVFGLKHEIIQKKFKSEFLNILFFILFNFKKWDILQCYHISRNSIIYLLFFKLLKLIYFQKSVTYLKFDSNDLAIKYKLSSIVIFLLRNIDILSVESRFLYEFYSNQKKLKGKIILVPNGISQENKKYFEKDNYILTVGRLGTKEKNTELLLEEFSLFSRKNKNWKLVLVGPIQDDFNLYLENFFNNNSELKERIMFTGNITDRSILNTFYQKAKIFVLTSPMEGFPLVFLEALSNGCHLITKNFSSAADVTNNGLYGDFFDDSDSQLHKVFLAVTSDEYKLRYTINNSSDYVLSNFNWNKICDKLYFDIEKKLC